MKIWYSAVVSSSLLSLGIDQSDYLQARSEGWGRGDHAPPPPPTHKIDEPSEIRQFTNI